MGIVSEQNINNTNENGYKRERIWKNRCIYMFRYTYAGIRIINMRIEEEDRHMRGVIHITRTPCQIYLYNSQEKKKEIKKVVTNTKVCTNHAALATQVERQVEKKVYTNDTDS